MFSCFEAHVMKGRVLSILFQSVLIWHNHFRTAVFNNLLTTLYFQFTCMLWIWIGIDIIILSCYRQENYTRQNACFQHSRTNTPVIILVSLFYKPCKHHRRKASAAKSRSNFKDVIKRAWLGPTCFNPLSF